MNIASIYKPGDEQLGQVEEALEGRVQSQDRFISQLGSYVLEGAGKRLRPALLLLAAKAVSDKFKISTSHFQIIPLAAAIELIHTPTLLSKDSCRYRLRKMGKAQGSIDYTLKKAKIYIETAREKIGGLKDFSSKQDLLNLADDVGGRA